MPKIKGPSPEQIAENLQDSPDRVAADLGFAMMIAYRVLAWFAVIPGVLGLRSRYGERYLTPDVALFSWSIVALCTWAAALSGYVGTRAQSLVGQAEESSLSAALILPVYSLMLCLRFCGVLSRWVRDDFSVHSYSDGDPWSVWYFVARIVPGPIRDIAVRCVLEPSLVFVVGAIVANATGSRFVGFLVAVTWLGFFMQQVLLQQEVRGKLLDAADAEIEAEELRHDRARLQGHGAGGISVAPPRARSALSALGLEQFRAARAEAQRQAAERQATVRTAAASPSSTPIQE
jgi:hypothetical protein